MVDLLGLINIVDFSIISAALSVTAGVINSIFSSRRAERQRQTEIDTRKAQVAQQILDKTTSREGMEYGRICSQAKWSDYDEWLERYWSDEDYKIAFRYWMHCFEHTGVYLKEDILDIRLLALRSAWSLIWWWEKHRDVIYNERKRRNNRRYCDMWEYAYDQLMKYLEENPELAP